MLTRLAFLVPPTSPSSRDADPQSLPNLSAAPRAYRIDVRRWILPCGKTKLNLIVGGHHQPRSAQRRAKKKFAAGMLAFLQNHVSARADAPDYNGIQSIMTDIDLLLNARIKFGGWWVGRDGDSHNVFVFSADGLPELNGEFFQMWASNRNDYNLEFGTFGVFHRGDFGNPDPGLRQHFSAVEASAIEQRLSAHDPDTFPKQFRPRPGFQGFLGGVSFRPGWILRR